MKYNARYILSKHLKKLGFFSNPEDFPAVKEMLKTIKSLEGKKIIFEMEYDEDGNWAVESMNISGIVTGGNFADGNNIAEVISDAIFTYFEIPPQYCDSSILIKNSSYHAERQTRGEKMRARRNLFAYHQTLSPSYA